MSTNYETNLAIKRLLDRTGEDLRHLHQLIDAASSGSVPHNLVLRAQSLEVRTTSLYRKMLEREKP